MPHLILPRWILEWFLRRAHHLAEFLKTRGYGINLTAHRYAWCNDFMHKRRDCGHSGGIIRWLLSLKPRATQISSRSMHMDMRPWYGCFLAEPPCPWPPLRPSITDIVAHTSLKYESMALVSSGRATLPMASTVALHLKYHCAQWPRIRVHGASVSWLNHLTHGLHRSSPHQTSFVRIVGG